MYMKILEKAIQYFVLQELGEIFSNRGMLRL